MWTALAITSGAFAMMFEGRKQHLYAKYAWYSAGTYGAFLLLSLLTTRSKLKRRRR
jgi:hypothetical protein